MSVFIINLERDLARKEFMAKQLTALGIDHEFITATDGKLLKNEEIENVYDKVTALEIHGHELSKTQIACALSHRRIYEKIKAAKLPWALILEDDVVLDKKVTSILNDTFVSNSRADWLQIDYLPFNVSFIQQWLRASVVRIKRQPLFLVYAVAKAPFLLLWGIFEYGREILARTSSPRAAHFPRPLYLASAYIITAAGVEKILPLCTPIRFAADQVQNRARIQTDFTFKAIVPLLASQDRARFNSNVLYDNQ